MSEFLTEHQKAVLQNRKNVRAIYLELKKYADEHGYNASRWKLCTLTASRVNMTAGGVSLILKNFNL